MLNRRHFLATLPAAAALARSVLAAPSGRNAMFVRRLRIDRIALSGDAIPCPVQWLDSFAMRNFTNDAIFDDTLPITDGLMEAGLRVPLALLQERMTDWFRRKGYLQRDERIRIQQETANTVPRQEQHQMAHEAGTAPQRVFIGTSNPRPGEGDGPGIFAAFFKDGQLTEPQLVAPGLSPSYLVMKAGTHSPLYTILGGDFGNAVAASYATAADDESTPQTLTQISQADCGSPGGCHASLSKDGRILLSANYTGASVASFLCGPDGSLSVASLIQVPPVAIGPIRHRQEAPHPHCAYIAPGGNFVLVNDLGLDCILVLKLDKATGKLSWHTPDRWNAAPGAGPRHILIHPNGKWIYNINELNSTINQLAWDAELGTLTELSTIRTLPAGMEPTNLKACEMIFSYDMRFLYASNRDFNSFVVYVINPGTGALELLQEINNPGKESRHIAFDATGKWFLSANQYSADISVFPVDPATGLLSPRSSYVEIDGPSCLLFA